MTFATKIFRQAAYDMYKMNLVILKAGLSGPRMYKGMPLDG